jgi:hypothetical protein
MKLDDLTIGEARQLAALLGGPVYTGAPPGELPPCLEVGRYVLVRCRGAGVHVGILEGRTDHVVRLRDSRRCWRWWSRFTLSELADEGVRPDKVSECRFSAPTPETIELAEWLEIRPCSGVAERSLRAVPNANA